MKIKKAAKTISLLLFFLSVFAVFYIIFLIFYFSGDLPDYQDLKDYQFSKINTIYSGNNQIISEIGAEKRIFTSIEKIPEKLINAFVSAEDKNFYTNSGIDVFGIIRAGITNIFSFWR